MKHPVFLADKVIKGFGRGSKTLDCPTANITYEFEYMSLPSGIYSGLAQLVIFKPDQIQAEPGYEKLAEEIREKLPYVFPVQGMVCSFGYNPHFGNKSRSLEVHILAKFNFNFYGAEVRVLICNKMRDEKKYNSIKELKDAIANDIKEAKNECGSHYTRHIGDKVYFLKSSSSKS